MIINILIFSFKTEICTLEIAISFNSSLEIAPFLSQYVDMANVEDIELAEPSQQLRVNQYINISTREVTSSRLNYNYFFHLLLLVLLFLMIIIISILSFSYSHLTRDQRNNNQTNHPTLSSVPPFPFSSTLPPAFDVVSDSISTPSDRRDIDDVVTVKLTPRTSNEVKGPTEPVAPSASMNGAHPKSNLDFERCVELDCRCAVGLDSTLSHVDELITDCGTFYPCPKHGTNGLSPFLLSIRGQYADYKRPSSLYIYLRPPIDLPTMVEILRICKE